jgi:hypothetical protein
MAALWSEGDMKSLLSTTLLMLLLSCNSYEGREYASQSRTSDSTAAQEEHDHTADEAAGDQVAETETEDTAEEPADDVADVPPPPPVDPNLVTFAIVAGTGTNAYNQKATPVVVKVGQTLRITNNDTVVHQIHSGGAPFPHGDPIAPGATVNYTIVAASNIANLTQAPNYDHVAGQAAMFWIQANP